MTSRKQKDPAYINFIFLCWRIQNKNLEIWTNFAHGCAPLLTRTTRVTWKTISLFDNISTNFIFDTSIKLKKRIIKSYVSEHFFYFFSKFFTNIHKENQKIIFHKSVMHDTNLTAFKRDLHNVNWNSINNFAEKNSSYKTFF